MTAIAHYLLHIWGDVDPEVHGPFLTRELRDEKAIAVRRDDNDDCPSGLFPLDVTIIDGEPCVEVNVYSGDFFDALDRERIA